MKKSSALHGLLSGICLIYLLNSQFLFAQCTNAGFENGNFSGWTGTNSYGVCLGIPIPPLCGGCAYPDPFQNPGIIQGPNNAAPDITPQYHQFIMTGGNDPNLQSSGVTLPVVYPAGGNYSARLGNMWVDNSASLNPSAETLSFTFTVTQNNSNFTYHYAVALTDGGHPTSEQPYFQIRMKDGNNNPLNCATYDVDATTAQTIGGFQRPGGGSLWFKPWSSVFIPLNNYIGQTVTITFITRSCRSGGCFGSHYAYAYLDAECGPLEIISSSATVCGGQNITLTAPAGAGTYSWTGPGIVGSPNNQIVTVNMAGLYTVNMTTLATVPCNFSIDTIIAASPGNPNADFSATTVCAGNPTDFTDLSTPGGITSWSWDFNNDGTADATIQNPSYTFATAGTYPVKLTVGLTPCLDDTIINVDVSASPNSIFTAISPLCADENSTITYTGNAPGSANYTWDFAGGTIVSGSGQGPYEVSWPTDGTKNIMLTVNAGTCVSGVTTVPVVVNLSPQLTVSADVSICTGGSTVLTASGATTIDWSPPTGLNTTSGNSVTATPASTTTYTVIGTTSVCSDTTTVTVSVNLFLTSTFTATTPLCEGQVATITYTGNASGTATYTWDFDGGAIISGSGQGPYSVNWQTQGTKSLRLIVSESGCASSPTPVSVTVNQAPVSDAGADVTFCSGDNDRIGALSTPGYTYQWSPSAGLSSTTVADPTITLTNATNLIVTTDYIVTTTGIGCFSTDTVAVSVVPIPVADFIPPGGQCGSGNSFSFVTGGSFLPNATFDWSFQNGAPPSSTQQDPVGIVFYPAGNSTVTLTITQSGCVSTPFAADITVYPNLVPEFTADTTFGCGSLTVNFSFSGTTPAGTVDVWSWDFGDGGTSSLENPTHTYTAPGMYNVTLGVTSSDSCTSAVLNMDFIRILNIPVADFTADNYIVQLPNSAVHFTNESQFSSSHLWDFGNGSSSTDENPSSSYTNPGTYPVTLYASVVPGCEDSLTKEITVNEAEAVYIPTAFSPNGDGRNDFYRVKTENATLLQLMIFNRWGEKVFETSDIKEGWDGYYKGNAQDLGVYTYVVVAVFNDLSERTYSGNLTLIR